MENNWHDRSSLVTVLKYSACGLTEKEKFEIWSALLWQTVTYIKSGCVGTFICAQFTVTFFLKPKLTCTQHKSPPRSPFIPNPNNILIQAHPLTGSTTPLDIKYKCKYNSVSITKMLWRHNSQPLTHRWWLETVSGLVSANQWQICGEIKCL